MRSSHPKAVAPMRLLTQRIHSMLFAYCSFLLAIVPIAVGIHLALASTVLREFSPCPFFGPPNDHASAKNENRQRKPCIEVNRNDTRSQHEHRLDNREIVGARVAAVGTPAPL